MASLATTLLVLCSHILGSLAAPQAVGRGTLDEPIKNVPGPEKNFSGFRVSKNSKQIIYYHEQTIAVVELGSQRSLLNCELLEVRTARDRNAALNELQFIEKKTKLSLRYMMDLMRQCEKLPRPDQTLSNQIPSNQRPVTPAPPIFSSLFMGLFPNTKWCGRGDSAITYFDLGPEEAPDRCCRTHDLCPVKVASMSTQYNVTNHALTTRSHCLCDEAFFNCLKTAKNSISDLIGNVYFNIGNLQCVDDAAPNNKNKGKKYLRRNSLIY